jgi:hypothetical protein
MRKPSKSAYDVRWSEHCVIDQYGPNRHVDFLFRVSVNRDLEGPKHPRLHVAIRTGAC